MTEAGRRTPAQTPKGGYSAKTRMKRDEALAGDRERFKSNVGKTFVGKGGEIDREANESFAAVRTMLDKAVLRGGTSNHYAAQYRADLVDTYNDYSRQKRNGMNKGVSSPPTEKEIRENPERLNEWISEVGESKAYHARQSELFKQGKLPGQSDSDMKELQGLGWGTKKESTPKSKPKSKRKPRRRR